MKKITAVLPALLMVLPLAACAGETETSGSTEPPQTSTSAPQTPDETQAPSEMGNESQQPSETPDGIASEPSQEPSGGKILVAYFSATNNTEGVAQKLADGFGADLYEIVPEQPYTDEDLDYNSDCRANREQNDSTARLAGLNVGLINKYYDIAAAGDPLAAEHYKTLARTAADCVGCGHCGSRCPFHVEQSARMKEIAEYFA